MTDSTITEARPSLLMRGWSLLQWLLAVPLFLIALLAFAIPGEGLDAPGAPVTAYYGSVAMLAAVAAALSPPVFFRLPKFGKLGAYIGILVGFVFFGSMAGELQSAFERTPEGAKVAQERAAEEAAYREAAQRSQEAQSALAAVDDQIAQLERIQKQQENCLSWGGQLSDLSARVQESLHNPESFEHVSTEFIVPEEDRFNVLLTFRAENGFGAIRAARLKAQMVPATCEILKVAEPEPL